MARGGHLRRATLRRLLMATAVAALTLAGSAVTAVAAAAVPGGGQPCAGPEVLLVHDLAGTSADWVPLADDLLSVGWCPVAVHWGRPRPGDASLPVGGLTGVGAGAAELARVAGWGTGASPVPVVAKGVGGLVVQCALQLAGPGPQPVSALVALGPVWNGTNVLGIADVEDLSRELGTFDSVLAWERTWMDPVCEGCREAVRGSELLVRMHADGIRTPGVRYTDIVSPGDLMIHPPLEQSPPGTDVRVLGPPGSGAPVWHGELGRDPGSRRLVVEALGPT